LYHAAAKLGDRAGILAAWRTQPLLIAHKVDPGGFVISRTAERL
jgi:hypothetical protein